MNVSLLKECFEEVFDLAGYQCETLTMDGFEQWDSVNHMRLIDCVETTFTISVDFDHIMELRSFREIWDFLQDQL